jgi:hypothetical protein
VNQVFQGPSFRPRLRDGVHAKVSADCPFLAIAGLGFMSNDFSRSGHSPWASPDSSQAWPPAQVFYQSLPNLLAPPIRNLLTVMACCELSRWRHEPRIQQFQASAFQSSDDFSHQLPLHRVGLE